MAFDPNNKSIKKALKESDRITKQEVAKENKKDENIIVSINPVADDSERVKNYTFTLKPSVRKRLKELTKKYNFSSDSKFLTELINNVKE